MGSYAGGTDKVLDAFQTYWIQTNPVQREYPQKNPSAENSTCQPKKLISSKSSQIHKTHTVSNISLLN